MMLGIANLGNNPQGYFGGFFTTGSNVIVLNKIPLERVMETRPELYKPYVFHVLLHEYIHSLGFLDESDVKSRVLEITKKGSRRRSFGHADCSGCQVFHQRSCLSGRILETGR